MSNFDVINDSEGKEYLVFDRSELYDDSQIGAKLEDFEILKRLGGGAFGEVFKVRSKINNKVYAMKIVNIIKLKEKNEKAYTLTLNETLFLQGLSHPHIIKYYTNFTQGDYLYIIIEFVANGDLDGFMEAHKIFDKHIQEEEIWSLFLQCMDALEYIHSRGIIHRDIKPENLLMDNNMTVKLGDFGVSTIKADDSQYSNVSYDFQNKNMQYHGTVVGSLAYMSNEVKLNDYDQKADVFSMGVSFFELCYFYNPIIKKNKDGIKGLYSDELYNIIIQMMEEDKDKRETSKYFLNKIKEEYSKKYMKNTSIDSIIRCLYSFDSLNTNFAELSPRDIENKPITKAYKECLDYISKNGLKSEINPIKNIRQILSSENSKLQGAKEVDPRYAFAFLIKELHKELNKPPEIKSDKNIFLINSGDEDSKIDKEEVMIRFVNNTSSKMNSFISNNFRGLMTITNFCGIRKCSLRTFSFTNFFFITFNLEKMVTKINNFKELDIKRAFDFVNSEKIKDIKYCNKCLKETKNFHYKQFYSLPNLLVFSIQRGITYKLKHPVIISEKLDLKKDVKFKYSKTKYHLVGFLGRNDNDGNESFFSVAKSQNSWILCEGSNINEIKSPLDYNSKGDIIMLFYQAD